MPYRICKTFEIENGHMLSKHPENCRFPHGHSRTVEIVLEADTLDNNDMVCDFKAVKDLMHQFLQTWDHALCMNTQDPQFETLKKVYGERIIPFPNQDPTTEIMARAIFDKLQENLRTQLNQPAQFPIRPNVRVVKIRLWETSSSWAEYAEE